MWKENMTPCKKTKISWNLYKEEVSKNDLKETNIRNIPIIEMEKKPNHQTKKPSDNHWNGKSRT